MPSLSSTLPKEKRQRSVSEVSLGYPKKVCLTEAQRCPQCSDPVCKPGCPLGVDIPGFIRLLREGNPTAAYQKIKEQNEFPSICGRICLAPCEKACVFHKEDNPIGIRTLERYAADHGRGGGLLRKAPTLTGKKVAVVGSGPAGMTAAAQLARQGFRVTIFESLPLAGGVLRYGIPEFRLPRDILETELQELKWQGVEIKTNIHIGQAVSIKELFAHDFAAVLLTAGAGSPRFSELPGAESAGVYYAAELLIQFNLIHSLKNPAGFSLGSKVVVLGTSSAAIDAARVCRRLERDTTLVLPMTEEDVLDYPQELVLAKEEGVRVEALTKAVEILSNEESCVTGLKCKHLDFASEGQSAGKWVLAEVPESEFILSADSVILAQGLRPSTGVLRVVPGLKTTEQGTVWIDPQTRMTSVDKVFAAGDVASACGSVVEAMASGKKAAQQIAQYLKK